MKIKTARLLKQVTKLFIGARESLADIFAPVRHHIKTAGLILAVLVLVAQMGIGLFSNRASAAEISSVIDTSTASTATAYTSQRKVDRTQNGVLWTTFWNGTNSTTAAMEFWYSTDDGATWNDPGSGSYFGFVSTGTSHTPNASFFIDLDDYAHVAYKDRSSGYIYYRRGTPNTERTSWTWSAAQTIYNDFNTGQVPDVVAHREGSGWAAHIVYSAGTTATYAHHRIVHITSGGTMTVEASPLLGGVYNSVSAPTHPSIDFNHTGDGKTVAGDTPHLYVAWSAGKTGTGFGVRFKKATYSGGSWTWGSDQEIDSARYYDGEVAWLNTLWDGNRIVLAGQTTSGTMNTMLYQSSDGTSWTTTTLQSSVTSGVNNLSAGSASYDSKGNLYYFGKSGGVLAYRKWTRSTNTFDSTWTVIDNTNIDTTQGTVNVSAKRGYSDGKVELIYTDGTGSPYSVQFWGKDTHDVVITTPDDGAELYYNQPQTFEWNYVASGSQTKYALKRSVTTNVNQTYNYTGSTQDYIVPSAVTTLGVELWGAQGGNSSDAVGGLGGFVEGDIPVTPGETLKLYVGGQPSNYIGDWNGGGSGGSGGDAIKGGGGGGATDIRQGGTALADRIIIAGGGGGAGDPNVNSPAGGTGGGLTGGTGEWGNGSSGTDGPGEGGTQSAGGAAGTTSYGTTSGQLGQGGNGATTDWTQGGGGGGGYYGGGGGGGTNSGWSGSSGGGGGSGFIGNLENASMTSGARVGNGQITIVYSVSEEWWNATTSQWVTTETWNSSATESVTFPADSWAEGEYEWSVAVENDSAAVSDYSVTRSVSFVDPPPSAPTLNFPGNGSAVNFNNSQRFDWTFNDSGDTQSAYALKRQEVGAGPQANELPTVSTVDNTSTDSLATAYSNQRKLDRTSNGVLWASAWTGLGNTSNSIRFWYSTDNGATWNYPGHTSAFGFATSGTTYTPDFSFFIDADDYAHVVYKDRSDGFIYYRRGTPNTERTAWTWTSAHQIVANTATDYPDIVAHREGADWKAHIVWSTSVGRAVVGQVTITSGGTITVGGGGGVIGGPYDAGHVYPSIDFNHTGDGKTVAGGTPHLYAAWSAGTSGTGFGVRFKKATYNAGTWTWGTEREIDSGRYKNSGHQWFQSIFDGTRVMIVGNLFNGSSRNLFVYERDAADTATTQHYLSGIVGDGYFDSGGVAHDSSGNLFLVGTKSSGVGGQGIYLSKWLRSSPSNLGTFQYLTSVTDYSRTVSIKRGYSGNRIDAIFTNNSVSPYAVEYVGLNTGSILPSYSQIDTSTAATTTAYGNQRKIDRTSNGVLWASFSPVQSSLFNQVAEFWYSTNNGATWTQDSTITSLTNGNIPTNGSFFIDADDYAHYVYKRPDLGYIEYRRGTPNAGRTSWTWSNEYTVALDDNNVDYPDVVAFRTPNSSPTTWDVVIVAMGVSDIEPAYERLRIANDGTVTTGNYDGLPTTNKIDAMGALRTSEAPTAPASSISVDFNHTGDGKTVASDTPHIYVAWSQDVGGPGKGIRFRKATYSGGSWTWDTEREIDTSVYTASAWGDWLNCMFDGTRIMITGSLYNGSSTFTKIYERDAADTTTTTRLSHQITSTPGDYEAVYGSATYDGDGNIYLIGRDNNDGTNDLYMLKWSRTSGAVSRYKLADIIKDTPYVSLKRGYSDGRVEAIYSDNSSSPYSITYFGHVFEIDQGGEQWWNAGSSSWSSSEVWNTSGNGYVDFASGTWDLDINYQWSVATKDAEGKTSPYSTWSAITVPTMDGMMRHGQFFTESGGNQPYYFRWFGN